MPYEIIPHTADVGIEVRAPELPVLFADAARALAAIILDDEPDDSDDARAILVEGSDLEDTLVQFLEECLYRFETRGELVVGADLRQVSPTRAEGDVYVVIDSEPAGPMIKAVTYHGLTVSKTRSEWMARVYVDV